jgi:hypothetical protein
MTELEAVNQMIEMLGEPRVDSFPTAGDDYNIDLARTTLDRLSGRVQAKRQWVSNTDYLQIIALNGDSKIPLPANTIAVNASGQSNGLRIAFRDGFLYDPINATDVFTDSVTLDITTKRDLDELPPNLAEYVVAEATVDFLRVIEREPLAEALSTTRLRDARRDAFKEDNAMRGANMLNNMRSQTVRGSRLSRNSVIY